MHTISRFFTVLIIIMVLIPSIFAAPVKDTNTKGMKITDLSKGTMKEIKDGKVNGIKSSSSDIVVDEKGKNHIKLKDTKPSKIKNGHKKVKVSIPKSELQKIDVDNDGKFGVLEIADGVVINQYTATSAQLTAGIDLTFSEVIVSGASGYNQLSFTGYIANNTQLLDADGVSVFRVRMDGALPFLAMDENNISTYPASGNVSVAYAFTGNLIDVSGHGYTGTANNLTVGASSVKFNGIDTYIKGGNVPVNSSMSYAFTAKLAASESKVLLGKGRYQAGGSYVWQGTSNNLRVALSNATATEIITGSTNLYTAGNTYDIGVSIDNTSKKVYFYRNGTLVDTKSYTIDYIPTTAAEFILGAASTGPNGYNQHSSAEIYKAAIYDRILTQTEFRSISIGQQGSSVSFNSPVGTRYPITSSNTTMIPPETITSVNILSNTNTSESIVYWAGFTQSITMTTETSTDDFWNSSIVYSPSSSVANGTIARMIPPLYTGTAVLDSNNTNAVMVQNRTHYTIYTGTLTAGSWAGYNVSVPNNADHGMWLNILMKWSNIVSGWIFGETAPTDYTNDISNEITVTVS